MVTLSKKIFPFLAACNKNLLLKTRLCAPESIIIWARPYVRRYASLSVQSLCTLWLCRAWRSNLTHWQLFWPVSGASARPEAIYMWAAHQDAVWPGPGLISAHRLDFSFDSPVHRSSAPRVLSSDPHGCWDPHRHTHAHEESLTHINLCVRAQCYREQELFLPSNNDSSTTANV